MAVTGAIRGTSTEKVYQELSLESRKSCLTKFLCHHKWNESWLLVINMVYTSCLTCCQTTKDLGP